MQGFLRKGGAVISAIKHWRYFKLHSQNLCYWEVSKSSNASRIAQLTSSNPAGLLALQSIVGVRVGKYGSGSITALELTYILLCEDPKRAKTLNVAVVDSRGRKRIKALAAPTLAEAQQWAAAIINQIKRLQMGAQGQDLFRQMMGPGAVTMPGQYRQPPAGMPGQVLPMTTLVPGKPYPIVQLPAGHSLQVATSLERVFLGLGWTNATSGETIDVDASCIAFSGGQAKGAVWWSQLNRGTPPVCSIVHTGDILVGQKHQDGSKGAQLEDAERIYTWLSRVEKDVDTLIFVANVYTNGKNFSDLGDAYIRLCNADSNQELGRMKLAGPQLKGNSMVFAKLFRCGGQWQFMSLGKGLPEATGRTWEALVPGIVSSGCAQPMSGPQQPHPFQQQQQQQQQPWSGAQQQHMFHHQQQQQQYGQQQQQQYGQQQQQYGQQQQQVPYAQPVSSAPVTCEVLKPISVQKSPKLARASMGGVAAATAIFVGGALTLNMLDPDIFDLGVDFGDLSDLTDAVPDIGLGDAVDWVGDTGGEALNSMGDAGGDALNWAGDAGGDAVNWAGDAGGDALNWAGDAGGDAFDWAGNAGGGMFSLVGDGLGHVGDGLGFVASGVGDGLGSIASGMGELAGHVGPALGEAGSCLGGVFEGLGSLDL
jgi:tellurium resistance protein TerD